MPTKRARPRESTAVMGVGIRRHLRVDRYGLGVSRPHHGPREPKDSGVAHESVTAPHALYRSPSPGLSLSMTPHATTTVTGACSIAPMTTSTF